MRGMTRWILFALFLCLSAGIPAPLQAAEQVDCTKEYMSCINDAGLLESPFQELADIECAAEYTGCVARKLVTW